MEHMTKRRMHEILEAAKVGDTASKVVDSIIMTLITLNVVLVVVESVDSLNELYGLYFIAFEAFSVVVFTVEYALRLWCCIEDERYRDPVRGRIRYAFSPMALVDLMAIIPFFLMYLPVIPLDARIAKVLRLFRMFRLLKLARYSTSMQMMLRVTNRAREELLITLVSIVTVITIISTVLYYVEHEAQIAAGKDGFSSIPMSMYWGAVTVSTVGYGDVTPITSLGRLLAGCISVFGIGLFAMPTAILSYEFMKEVQGRRKMDMYCPHCGELIETPKTRSTDAPDRRQNS